MDYGRQTKKVFSGAKSRDRFETCLYVCILLKKSLFRIFATVTAWLLTCFIDGKKYFLKTELLLLLSQALDVLITT